MSFDNEAIFTKENLDGYLKELAKAFRKRNGTSMPAEIILVGGAAILVCIHSAGRAGCKNHVA